MTTDIYIIFHDSKWWALNEDGMKCFYASVDAAMAQAGRFAESEGEDLTVHVIPDPAEAMIARLEAATL